jgi:uncharacterized membrane protein
MRATGSRESLESRLGSQVFNRIAIVLLLIGTAYFLKLAIDRQWIGPAGRVIAGLLAGAGLVVWSERFRRKGFPAFSYSLKAVGSGVLYLSLWAAFQLFHLLPAGVALALMVLVTAWNAYMAWAQNAELLGAYALAGGFATPLLVSTGGNHEAFLFTYLLAMNLATVALVRLKCWPRLLPGAFLMTVAYFAGWYMRFFAADELALTAIFILLFGAAFGSVPLGRRTGAEDRFARLAELLEDVLLPLGNAAFVALALYCALKDSAHYEARPWMMVALAAAYLAVMRVRQSKTASALHLSLAVVLLTIAIPLKASGHWITVSWLVEGLALVWVAVRVGEDETEISVAATLRTLAMGSLGLGFCGVVYRVMDDAGTSGLSLFNHSTGTALTAIAVFAATAWMALRADDANKSLDSASKSSKWDGPARLLIAGIVVVALLLTLRELVFSHAWQSAHPPFQTSDFFTALIGLAVLAGVIGISLRTAKRRPADDFWKSAAGGATIAFNLVAVLTGVREIGAMWTFSSDAWDGDAALQQALAISAFLMLYGAALLAVGFWKRSGFLRWQALALLVFSICKAFLYDMRSLSQGYRVVSILGLGTLLMAISFAYQKDWLNLREPDEQTSQVEPEESHDSDPGTDTDTGTGEAR